LRSKLAKALKNSINATKITRDLSTPLLEEKNLNSDITVDESDNENGKKKKKKKVIFDDCNVDLNLHKNATQSIKSVKIKLAAGLILYNHIISGWSPQYSNDFAAITFMKKMKDETAFEFNIPMTIAPILQKALQHIINVNKDYYSGMKLFHDAH